MKKYLSNEGIREKIKEIIKCIEPVDTIEADHRISAIGWIDKGEEIFRIVKPANPPKHLVSYFVLIDTKMKKIMLVDHIKSGLWLPAGGHVEKNEHPNYTVEREIQEELSIDADYIYTKPIFLTQTVTVGTTAGHTDVSLWYLLRADSTKKIAYDCGEFHGYNWFDYGEIQNMDISKMDPHMHRFFNKLCKIGII